MRFFGVGAASLMIAAFQIEFRSEDAGIAVVVIIGEVFILRAVLAVTCDHLQVCLLRFLPALLMGQDIAPYDQCSTQIANVIGRAAVGGLAAPQRERLFAERARFVRVAVEQGAPGEVLIISSQIFAVVAVAARLIARFPLRAR